MEWQGVEQCQRNLPSLALVLTKSAVYVLEGICFLVAFVLPGNRVQAITVDRVSHWLPFPEALPHKVPDESRANPG